RLFFENRLAEVRVRNADVLAELVHLLLGQAVADVPLARLQLGGALDDAFDRRAVEAWPGGNDVAHFLASSSAGAVTGMGFGNGMPVEAGSAGVRDFMKSTKGERRSSGTGRTSVDLFSAATSTTVWR